MLRRSVLLMLALAAGCPKSTTPGPTLPPPQPVGPAPEPTPAPIPDPGKPQPVPASVREPWRSTRPAPAAMRDFQPPKVTQIALKNGIPVYVVENHAFPLVAVQVVMRAGATADEGVSGLPSLTANLLDEGAGKRTALQLAETADSLGTSLFTGADADSAFAGIDGLKDKLGPSLDVLADVVLRPTFDPKEIDRVKNEVLADLKRQRDSGRTDRRLVLQRIVYGEGHPYAFPAAGHEDTLAKVGKPEVTAFYQAYWQPKNAAIVVAGDITAAQAKTALDARFGAWKAPAGAKSPPPPAPPPDRTGKKIYLVDRPGAEQGDVAAGFAAPPRNSPDWPALMVVNNAVGGMFSARLNMFLREEKGWSYGAFSTIDPRVGAGMFWAGAGIVSDHAVEGVGATVHELEGIKSKPPTGEELQRAKDAESLSLAGYFTENATIARTVAGLVVYGMPLDYYEQYQKAVQAVAPEDAAAVAKKYWTTDRLTIVVVGDAAKLEKGLVGLKLGPVERRQKDGGK